MKVVAQILGYASIGLLLILFVLLTTDRMNLHPLLYCVENGGLQKSLGSSTRTH